MNEYRKVIAPFYCDTAHPEGDDTICDKHGFMWVDTRPFCNAISDDLIRLIQFTTGQHETLLRIMKDASRSVMHSLPFSE